MSDTNITTIRLVDKNVDGCGTDVDTVIDVVGSVVTKSTLDGIRNAVDKYKSEAPDGGGTTVMEYRADESEYFIKWYSDGCFDAAYAYLTKEGYKVTFHTPDVELILND